MARTRTTKKLAQRIDLNYFKRSTPLKRAKFWLSLLLPLLALLWIAGRTFFTGALVYSSGRLSEPHAILEKQCGLCHARFPGEFSAKANIFGCLNCHDGPMHHSADLAENDCMSCHSEHRGRINISAPNNESCAQCHADLRAHHGRSNYANRIQSFDEGHPEFAAVRSVMGVAARDPGTIKLNHAIHMKPIRSGPNGPNVQLACGNCHRPTAADADLTYADPKYRAVTLSYKDAHELLPLHSETLKGPRSVTGRELMAPVKFVNACAACHLLTFDKRFDYGVPHDKPEIIQAFLVRTYREYIGGHPSEVRVRRDPGRDLTEKQLSPAVRLLSPAQWVTERTAEAENLLWRKTCNQCHTLTSFSNNLGTKIEQRDALETAVNKLSSSSTELPSIAPASITVQWMPHAKFDHGNHEGFTCVSCHEKALTSTESSDVLLPGIETCKKCHAPGAEHTESRCFECHTYHDWSKRKEVTPKFTLPALRTGGR